MEQPAPCFGMDISKHVEIMDTREQAHRMLLCLQRLRRQQSLHQTTHNWYRSALFLLFGYAMAYGVIRKKKGLVAIAAVYVAGSVWVARRSSHIQGVNTSCISILETLVAWRGCGQGGGENTMAAVRAAEDIRAVMKTWRA